MLYFIPTTRLYRTFQSLEVQLLFDGPENSVQAAAAPPLCLFHSRAILISYFSQTTSLSGGVSRARLSPRKDDLALLD